jgi:hypothetical protein
MAVDAAPDHERVNLVQIMHDLDDTAEALDTRQEALVIIHCETE